ncbi:MAG: hypothetical protein IFK94_03340 [Acidobacteria bacterium]|uniref:AsmA domain-containing protein n=1 Tax=Candidatus Polarisedimenticola svalbardensis TaxID=2886004 RepID=A0A8J6Y740_9BACT|nr:hypothetical protein [Candidatus Polarisedimenticola svalbardensis]
MKKRRKIVLSVVLILALMAVAVALLPFLLNEASLQARAETSLSELLGRKVELGALSLKPGWGIRASTASLVIGEPLEPSAEPVPVIRADDFRFKLALLPLLKGEVDVRNLAFDAGEVTQDGQPLVSGLALRGRLYRASDGEVTFDGRLTGVADFLAGAGLDAEFRTKLLGDVHEMLSLEADLGQGRVTGSGRWTGIETGDLAGDLNITAVYGRTRVEGTVQVELPEEGTRIRFDMASPLVDFDELAVLAGVTGPPPADTVRRSSGLFPAAFAAEIGSPESSGSPIHATGMLTADKGIFSGMEMTGIRSRVELREGLLRMEEARFNLYGGEHAGTFRIDIESGDLPFHLGNRMEQVNLDGLLQAFSPESAGSILGTLALVLDLDGRAGEDSLEGTVTGTARLAVTEGALTGDSLVAGISRGLKAAGVEPPDGDVTPFESLTADFRIRDRLAITDNLELRSPHLDLSGRGSFGLDGSLDFRLDARLSTEVTAALVAKAGSLGNLVGGSGRLRIPIGISGTLEDPRVGVDLDNLVKGAAKERLKDKIKGLFRK